VWYCNQWLTPLILSKLPSHGATRHQNPLESQANHAATCFLRILSLMLSHDPQILPFNLKRCKTFVHYSRSSGVQNRGELQGNFEIPLLGRIHSSTKNFLTANLYWPSWLVKDLATTPKHSPQSWKWLKNIIKCYINNNILSYGVVFL